MDEFTPAVPPPASKSPPLAPKDHAEAVAVFRSEIVGALTRRDLDHGELRAALRALSQERFRPPGSPITRQYSETTLERWYYAYRAGGLAALAPAPRSDRGHAQELTAEQRQLLLDVRREHRSASVPLILRTLVADGRLAAGAVSEATVRRLYVANGLDRVPLREGVGQKTRLRWEAESPGALWHADVCHGPALTIDGVSRPLRIHALLDDASRFVVAIEARHTEREMDMIGLLVRALRRHGAPDVLYLDNGSTYMGEALRTACARLGISLLHARPYDAPARGKMERFWRTLREGCLDHLGSLASLHDVEVRLYAFLDEHYHVAPHASLMGRSPGVVFAEAKRPPDDLDEEKLKAALTFRVRRRVRADTTVSLDGEDFELDQGYLAGRLVTVARSLIGGPPWIDHDGKHHLLHPVDPKRNARRKRPPRRAGESEPGTTPFDPARALLDRATGKRREDDR
ncbi:MAG TPA: DDE-type integrase/transposase/recombinase [Anaeromyxobacteraceae bacterium]|nr:DDE-type integrase/transposase/recombinase [Anaeromyxobacteraceae bacterium]